MGRRRDKERKHEQAVEKLISELKSANRRLKSDNKRLLSEIATLEEAFLKTAEYLKKNTDNISVEVIVEGVKNEQTLSEIKKSNVCESCGSPDLKYLDVQNVGKIILCTACKHRKVNKYGKEKNNVE